MSFATLFTSLSAVEEVKSPGHRAFTRRNEADNDKGGNDRKRKTQGEQAGPRRKKQRYQGQTTTTYNATADDSETKHYNMHTTNNEHASPGFTREVRHRQNNTAGHKNTCYRGQNHNTRNNHNVNKQQEQKKNLQGQKTQNQWRDRGGPAHRGGGRQTGQTLRKRGGDRKYKNYKQGVQEKPTKLMTQEFKDQNVIEVDGRLLCRHFIYGKCIKGDDCQLEHVPGYNDLVKQLCKFYVLGWCSKGESCPFMHKTFPCKFFHGKGKCSQGADCKFSHEPLNDVTKQLLDEALKRESDLIELAKKAEQEPSGQPDEPNMTEASTTPDILTQSVRPNFYKSEDAEKEAPSNETEDVSDNMETTAAAAAQPHSPPSPQLNREEPVCYSVEAVLGPQLSKPFSSFLATPKSQDSAPSDCTLGSAHQSQVPYSVEAVLRSYKSVENSSLNDTPTPSATRTVSYTPKTHIQVITDPLPSSKTQNNMVLDLVKSSNERHKQERLFKSLPSLQVHDTFPNGSPASGDNRRQAAPTASPGVKSESLSTDVTSSVSCKGESALSFQPMKHKSVFSGASRETTTSTHPAEFRPHLPVQTSHLQASFKPFWRSQGLVKSSVSANSVTCHFASKQPTKIFLHSKKTDSGLTPDSKQDVPAECSSKMADCADVTAGCKKTLRSSFRSLFASPITDTLQPTEDTVTSPSCPQGSTQSPCPAPQSADKTAPEPGKTSSRSFLNLFASPLSASPPPCVQPQPDNSKTSSCSQQSVQSGDNTAHISDSRQRASDAETQSPHQVSHVTTSSDLSASAKMWKTTSVEHVNPPTKQLEDPVCSLVSASSTSSIDSPSTSSSHQKKPDISSHKGSAGAASASSVLKTLFQCLSPYQQDRERQDGFPSGSEKKDKSDTGCDFVKQQQKNKLEIQDSHKKSTDRTVAHSAEHQSSVQTARLSLEATIGSTLSQGITGPQIGGSGSHNLPVKQRHIQPRLKHTSEEGTCVNGSKAASSIKDLFKTLDTAFSHSGH